MLLHIACSQIPRLDQTRDDAMTFIAGFDPPEQATSPTMDTSYLVLNYPSDNREGLRARIGSADYIPS